MKEEFHLSTGYRIYYNYQLTIKSILQFHNETMNIWTHLLGFIVVVASLIDLLSNYSKDGFDDEVS